MRDINQNAPVVAKNSITIGADIRSVWKHLTNINAWSTWNTDISSADIAQPLVSGSTFVWKSGGMKIKSTLHTAEAPSKLGWTGKVMGIYAVHNWYLHTDGNSTTVIVEESMEGFLARLFAKSFQKTLDKGMESWLEQLKAVCER